MIKSPINPIYKYILIKRDEAKSVTSGGIVIPSTAREAPIRGLVLAVGQGRQSKSGKLEEPWVRPGDIIFYSKHAGKVVEHDGDEFLMIMDQDIFAVVKGKKKESLHPVYDRLLVKSDKVEKVSPGGIILTEVDDEKPKTGTVVSKGYKVSVNVGDKILHSQYDGLPFSFNDEEYLMLREEDLWAVIENDKD